MSLQHFFLEDQSIEQTLSRLGDKISFALELSSDDIKHARALRLKSGEHIGVIDCSGVFYECEVVSFDTRELRVCVAQKKTHTEDADCCHFAQATDLGNSHAAQFMSSVDSSSAQVTDLCDDRAAQFMGEEDIISAQATYQGVSHATQFVSAVDSSSAQSDFSVQSASQYRPAFEISLIFGLMKGSKNDEVIRACTEIGVAEFVPFAASRCVAKLDLKSANKKLERWKKIAKSAAMQSGQYRIPELCAPKDIVQVEDYLGNFDEVVLFWEEASISDLYKPSWDRFQSYENKQKSNSDSNSKTRKIAIVIGPEGGLTTLEVDSIEKANKNSQTVSLGRSILRAQTACVLACGLINYENEKAFLLGKN